MNLVHKIENWGDTHHPMVLDVVRVALGIFLMLKGFAFLDNSAYLKDMIEDQSVVYIPMALLMTVVYYVIFAHLVGGVLIAMGTLTRFACIIQIPIVLAAVFMTDFFTSAINSMAWPSIIALVLLVIFMVIGSGPLSLDRYLSKWEVV
ncbi:DoxX family protein [Mucilaginibacter sp. X4EP1]|uniref:DoxX family protein n=1 Tax=Mucilaginibacter sp. X4EP1 TaxID=2723092 RepID=UPI00216A3330|nr:DoxX family protein [Mucilaginibacter sp. X4EP1]MCS3815254.1 putative membrane protein YphA (DoxX/SURF4 family) [Mucilaginibacter sp. X4EP1]